MSSGNFNLRGWKSNLHSVEPIQDTSTDESVSVLDLVWHTDSDMLSCKIERTNISEKPITKRVAPVKTVTIPRLELLACLIGARLLSTVINDLKLYDVKIYYWADSTTALCWIQRQQNWGTFVQNRVQEICSLTSPAMWRHIPGTLNAADFVSRGCSGEHLLQGKWWEGPTWLLENEENWRKSEDESDEDLVNSEKRKTIVTTLTKTDENVNWYCKYLSSIRKIV
ncbi:integrase catalytic domain-containing protein [Trichonephila clavipes]|nr:integrase catalytic domain-containing protein [Trichonephila clavipes]